MTATALAPRAPPDVCLRPIPRVSPEVDRATALLLRGARCLERVALNGVLARPWPTGDAGGVRARYVANCLRELDTFLKGLLDELAPTPAGQPRRHNAANRVDALARGALQRLPLAPAPSLSLASDVDHLRALGRSRACLWHCHGLVRRTDVPDGIWMTAGWYVPASTRLRRYAIGERLAPTGTELAGVAAFYARLALKLADD